MLTSWVEYCTYWRSLKVYWRIIQHLQRRIKVYLLCCVGFSPAKSGLRITTGHPGARIYQEDGAKFAEAGECHGHDELLSIKNLSLRRTLQIE